MSNAPSRCRVLWCSTEVSTHVHSRVAYCEREHARVHAGNPVEGDDPSATGWVLQNSVAVWRYVVALPTNNNEGIVRRNCDISKRPTTVVEIRLRHPIEFPVGKHGGCSAHVDFCDGRSIVVHGDFVVDIDCLTVMQGKQRVSVAAEHHTAS